MITVRIFGSWDDVPWGDFWTKLDEYGTTWTLPHLAALVEAPPGGVRRLGLLVAFAGTQIIGLTLINLIDLFPVDSDPVSVLLLGDAIGFCTPSIALDRGHPARADALRALLMAGRGVAVEERAVGVMLYSVPRDCPDLADLLDEAKFVRYPAEPWAIVPLGGGLSPFPRALRGNYGSIIRRKQRDVRVAGVRFSADVAEVSVARLVELYERVADKKEGESIEACPARLRLPAAYFERMIGHPSVFTQAAVGRDGLVLGYNMSIRSGCVAQSLVVGMAAQELEEIGGPTLAPAVYQALHVEVLAAAERSGCRLGVLGTTAEEGKARLGALFRLMEESFLPMAPAGESLLSQSLSVRWPALPPCRPYAGVQLEEILRWTQPLTLVQSYSGDG